MNRTSLSTLADDERQVTHSAKPWWRTNLAPAGPVDLAGPRALRRLVNIAEMAGLLVTSSESVMLDAFRNGGPKRLAVATELDRFKCSLTDLYVLVTLFSAAPHPVPLAALSPETRADPLSLRGSLDHLDEVGAITTEADANSEPALCLTRSGISFAVLLTYRVINASISPP